MSLAFVIIGLPLSTQCFCGVLSLCVLYISVQRFLLCMRSNTRRWPNAGLMLAHRHHRWVSISPVLGYHVVFGPTLNDCQYHRWDGGPTWTQLCFKASCWYSLCYTSPLLTQQCVGVTHISPMSAIVYNTGQQLNSTGAVYTMCTHFR